MSRIRIGDKEYDFETVFKDGCSRKKYLARYRGVKGAVYCLCVEPAIPMSVRLKSATGTYYVTAQHPGDAEKHSETCRFREGTHKESSGDAGEGWRSSIEVTDDGLLNVNLELPLFIQIASEDTKLPVPGSGSSGEGEPQASMRTLLELLWKEAELNKWHPGFLGKRDYFNLSKRLQKTAEKITIKSIKPLNNMGYIPPKFTKPHREEINAAEDAFAEKLKPGHARAGTGILVGELKKIETAREGKSVVLRLAHTSRNISVWTDIEQWEKYSKRWFRGLDPESVAASLEDKPLIIAMGITGVKRKDGRGCWLRLEEMGVMEVSDKETWIPVDSDYERQMVKYLVDHRRDFSKPLQVERVGDELLPDFVLEDTGEETLVEVTGMMHVEWYQTQVDKKRDRYKAEGRSVLWWNPATEKLPKLPPKRFRRKPSN